MSEPKVKPYTGNQGSKREQVEQMFDNIAPCYDFLNRALSLGIDLIWRKQAIDQLKEIEPKTILDVATGTADLALEATRLKPEKIIGVDIADKMLAIGRDKIKGKHEQDVIFLENGDSANLRFEDHSFDAVTAAYGVRNFENLERGLAEMYRVLKPGGKMVILEFSKPEKFPVKQLFNLYFRYILPGIGRLISKDNSAYTYLPQSVKAFPQGNAFVKILTTTGLKQAQWIPQTFGISSIYTGLK